MSNLQNLPKLVPFKKKDDSFTLVDDKEYKKKILMLNEAYEKKLLEEEENKSELDEEEFGINSNITQNYKPKEWITTEKIDDTVIDGILIDEQQFTKQDAAKFREKKLEANKKKFNNKINK